MVQNNKVLTVSYGTFSCTLEGFDDAFDTMKAIAEYFRDLAADDRYFGAEPPQPDADMLARIAQGRNARQVEARRDGDGFVLRAGTPAIVAAPPPSLAPDLAPDLAPKPAPETVSRMPAAPPTAPIPETPDITEVSDPILVPASESIAAKLQRIRAVVSRNQEATEDYSEDEHAEAVTRPTTAPETVAPELVAPETTAPETTAPEMAAPETAVPQTTVAAADEVMDEDEIDFGAMLDRLEAGDSMASTTDQAADSLFGQLDVSGETEDDDASEQDLNLANILDQDEFDDDENDADDLDGDFDEDDDFDDEDEDDDVDLIVTPAPASAPDRARLVKIKRSRIAAAIASGELEEVAEEEPTPAPMPVSAPTARPAPALTLPPAGALSVEDEADLIRELAQVEAEFIGLDGDVDQPESTPGSTPKPAPEPAETHLRDDRPRNRLADLKDGNGDDVNRLMEATDRKLVDPEAAARHEAYNRMRAAVAATKAERSAGGTLGTHASDKNYRDDLASVVRPRRPEPGLPRPGRPTTETRAAPLRLVAEQRVDDHTVTTARTPVRPRRVTTQLLDEPAATGTPTPEGGFAEFAEEMGAQDLPDLLEAAAAYMSFVEGRDQFSRPQLMSKVRQVGGDSINREDSLRSFGQLLREGKIEKKGGGRFAASGQIGFRPDDDERAAG
jgi:hypothetical protein